MLIDALVLTAALLSTVPAGLRWLRVAQREHYLSTGALRFWWRWWTSSPANIAGALLSAAAAAASGWIPAVGFATAAVVAAGPLGLSVRGRTAPLAWTRRLRTLAATWAVLQALVVAVDAAAGGLRAAATAAVVGALACALVVDVACAVTAPFERRAANRYVKSAAERLRRVGPTVVAITGSYGKTSTKGYVAHLLGPSRVVVASPASFNNRAGLARAVNEGLGEGTDVFVAEMGTYGPGEIAELCRFVPPDVAVITAVGPVHLERFRTEDAIVAAKSEILERAATVVLPVDDPRLVALAAQCEAEGKTVWRVSASAGTDADVRVSGGMVTVKGEDVGRADESAPPTNVGCAVAVAMALGVEPAAFSGRLATLPTAPHRLEALASGDGRPAVLDDTYNANPAGARAALAALERMSTPGGRRVLVTPGMVELGPRQAAENASLAETAAAIVTDLVVVGRTNRRALTHGVSGPRVVTVRCRPDAVAWVRAELGSDDVVLYENDLPDHYP